MSEALRRFYEVWKQAGTDVAVAAAPVFFRGLGREAGEDMAGAMRALGMELERAAASGEQGQRLEFLSPKRSAWSGFWLEDLPREMGGDAVQRLFATAFLGLRQGAPLMVSFEHHDATALLAWLRQAGFHALAQAEATSGPAGQPIRMIIARRI